MQLPSPEKYGNRILKNAIQAVKHSTSANPLTNSSTYSSLLKSVFVPPTAQTKILCDGFKENIIQKVCCIPFAFIKEVKITTFQYKLIHNVPPTCAILLRDGLLQNIICNLCTGKKQTLCHLLINCAISDEIS